MGSTIRSLKLVILLIIAIFGATVLVSANSTGAPPSNTGAPGETTCNICHNTNPLNSGGGSVKITGIPATYTPGTRYNLTVTVAKAGAIRWGFQVTSLIDDGSPIGTFMITDTDNTQMELNSIAGKTRNYVTHTATGTRRGTKDTINFTFDWVAPTTNVGRISFYCAGNAANGDGTLIGDNIYTTTLQVTPQPTGPTLANLSPNHGPADGGTAVTLTGTNFKNGLTTTFDGVMASTTVVDDKSVRVVTPPHAAGVVDVIVTNTDGQTARLRGSFTYEAPQLPAPVLTGITPNTGDTLGGTDITLTGGNFSPGLTVMIGTKQAMMVSVTSTQITAKTPPSNPGPVDVVVTNPDGQVVVLTGAYTYVGDPPPVLVTLMTPNGGEVLSSGGFPFIINWMQMSSSAATQKLELSTDGGTSFNTVIADNLTADKTSFTYNIPAGITSSNARIRISVTDNGVVTADESDQNFRIVAAPILTNVAPKVAATIKLKITGQMFQSGSQIEVNGNIVTTTFKSATSLIAKKLDKSLAGTQIHVRIINPDGGISMEKIVTP